MVRCCLLGSLLSVGHLHSPLSCSQSRLQQTSRLSGSLTEHADMSNVGIKISTTQEILSGLA